MKMKPLRRHLYTQEYLQATMKRVWRKLKDKVDRPRSEAVLCGMADELFKDNKEDN